MTTPAEIDERERDLRYVGLILNRLRVCQNYRPRFGRDQATSLQDFQALYRADPFYAWFGLDHPLIYAAHRAAGGITSIYRQLGLGCEEVFRHVLMDQLGLTPAQIVWSYRVATEGARPHTLALDGCVRLADVDSPARRVLLADWLGDAARQLGVSDTLRSVLNGPAFEVRQGYKSKDSKRQNADLANAASAYRSAFLPVIVLLSTQIDEDVASRYRSAGLLLLYGALTGSVINSTYIFAAMYWSTTWPGSSSAIQIFFAARSKR